MNTLWSIGGQASYLIVALITNIILVRILDPYIFGQIGILMFLIVISSVLVESGLSGALIRRKKVTDIEYSTVFVFNLVVSFVIFILIYLSSSYIANFYGDESLKEIIIFLSLVLIINSLKITQNTRLMREMRFKEKSIYEFISITIASCISIFFATRGLGVWSLVILQLCSSIILTVLLWFFVGAPKKYIFDFKSFNSLYKFGMNTTFAALLDTIFNNIYQVFLGKYFSISQVGYFYQAKRLQEIPIGVMQISIAGVVYSALSKVKDNKFLFNNMYDQVLKIFLLISNFIFMILFLYAEFIIEILYGELWYQSVLYLRLLSLAALFYVFEIYTRNIFKVFNRTEFILRIEIVKKIIQSLVIVFGIYYMSIRFLLYGLVFVNFIGCTLSYLYSNKVAGFKLGRNLKNILNISGITIFSYAFGKIAIVILNLHHIYYLFSLLFITILYFLLAHIFSIFNIYDFLRKLSFKFR